MDKTIKNGHCVFFEGQTGECKAKEFQKCNPVRCKLYTLDSVSTILDLQKRNKELEDKFTKFFGINNQECWDIAFLKEENARLKQTLEEIEKLIKNDMCEPCKELKEDTCEEYSRKCDECNYSIIRDVINKAKRD